MKKWFRFVGCRKVCVLVICNPKSQPAIKTGDSNTYKPMIKL